MFNKELYHSNRKSILLILSFILVFAVINFFANDNTSDISYRELGELSDTAVGIHKLVINELMSANKGVLVDEKGNLCDWLEIYNGYSYSVNLKNYGLSDSNNGVVKWVFPDIEIPSNGYLIVYLSSETSGKLHANFSLKQEGGETVTLKKPNGKVIDSVQTKRLEQNVSMARDASGKWFVTAEATPGYENSKVGRTSFLSNHDTIDGALVLSEFLPDNKGNIAFNNKLYGYIEVMNVSKKTIHLKDYYLSNNEQSIYKWRLPDISLESGKTYLVYTSSLDRDNHASFELKHKNGNVILATYGGIVENVKYEELINGVAYVKEDNKWFQSINISPGYLNTPEGREEFQKKMDASPNDLMISELMSSNNQYLAHNGNQFYDWIELYNHSDQAINLKGYTLTTDDHDKTMYSLPERILLPGSYYLVMASGKEQLSGEYDHANFKLSSGSGLFLYKNSELVDSTYIYNIPKGYSYGRGVTSGHFYYSNPTPGGVNSEVGLRKLLYDPSFSVSGGVYNDVSSLEVKLDNSNFTDIFYTLDGSIPTNASQKYVAPIILTNTTVIRAVAYLNDEKVSEVVTNSYIINEHHTLPVVSLSMPNDSFQYVSSNINENILTAAHAELYEKNSSFSIDCSFKLFGSASRVASKKSFSLKFDYGHLHYKLFDDKDLWEFNALILRSGSQDQNVSMMRDEFATSIAYRYGTLDAQANKPVVLYINGSYWGIYFIREKINANFIEDNYNVNGATNITNYNFFVEEGTNTDMVNIRNYISRNDMSVSKNYEYISSVLDIDNYIDLWIYQYIVMNADIHNIRYYSNPNVANGKVRMILFDLDQSLYSSRGASYFDYIQYPDNSQSFLDTTILSNLMKNGTFRKRVVQRISYYLKKVWTRDHIQKEFDSLYNALSPEMNRNCIRWRYNCNSWSNNANFIKNFALNRIDQIKNEVREYFRLTQEEVNEYFG